MRLHRGLLAVVSIALLAACSSETNGTGTVPARPRPATVSPDFPSGATDGTPAPSDTTGPAGTTVPTTSTSAPTDTGTAAAAREPLRTARATGPDGTTYLVSIWAERNDPTCADHAYGKPVVDFLTTHRCGGLHRLLATTTVDARAVGLAVSDLGFVGTEPAVHRTAGDFVALVKRDGTGNIDDLMRSGSRLPAGPSSVPNPDVTTALGQDAGVEVVDAWYLAGPTASNDRNLIAMAQALFLQLG